MFMNYVQIFLVLLVIIQLCTSDDREIQMTNMLKNYPTPNSANNRVLGMILSFNFDHIDPMMLILTEYQSMCEGGWDPTIVFFTTTPWSAQMRRVFRQKAFCYRTNSSVPIIVSLHNSTIGTALGAQHRTYMQNEVNNFDVFVYHEDDILFKYSHLVGYLHETKVLHNLLPTRGLWESCIGFQRYRRLRRDGDAHSNHPGDLDIIESDLLEELPGFKPICVESVPYLKIEGNIHQAMWVLTRSQIDLLQIKCSFLNQSSASREYMSSFSLFDRKGGHCGLNKLLPGARLNTFTIYHYYQQRHVSWSPVFSMDESIRADVNNKNSGGACWNDIVDSARAEQFPPAVVAANGSAARMSRRLRHSGNSENDGIV